VVVCLAVVVGTPTVVVVGFGVVAVVGALVVVVGAGAVGVVVTSGAAVSMRPNSIPPAVKRKKIIYQMQ